MKRKLSSFCILLTCTGDRCQVKRFCEAKQFCLLDADCLVVGESQGSSSFGKYPVKPLPECDSQTIDTYRCRNTLIGFSFINTFYWGCQWDLNRSALQRYIACQEPVSLRLSYLGTPTIIIRVIGQFKKMAGIKHLGLEQTFMRI